MKIAILILIYLNIIWSVIGESEFIISQVKNTDGHTHGESTQLANIDNTEENSKNDKILYTFIFSFVGCVICCGLIQAILILSKRMNGELSSLRRNYKQHQGLLKFREFRYAYEKEKIRYEQINKDASTLR
ncbi:unnamed protein product [Blepharisma stoltei]|uniref:Uncharacterized protein n=1 Tax=Blepharisma stoltei TaxID=1481888 RepID=A0AAU9JU14_9CILI|nr:unnamed protein product [Blepharisma stoltei]